MTCGIAALQESAPNTFAGILTAIQTADHFERGNDPYGERDFGSVEVDGIRAFWKIDYYDAENPEFGSEDPSDPHATRRVLLVMLAEEY